MKLDHRGRKPGGSGLFRVIALIALGTSIGFAQTIGDADLTAKDVNIRRAAASRLRLASRPDQRAALPAMIDVLTLEKDGQVRLAILDAITALGPEAEPAIPALVQTLRTSYGGQGQEESHQDYRSALALAAIGRPSVEGLRGLLKERKESVRSEVVMALGRIGPDAEGAVPDLIGLLKDASARVRLEAARALGLIGRPAIGPLIGASVAPDRLVRSGAVEALGLLAEPDERAQRSIVVATEDSAPEVRASAIRSLSRLGLPDDVLLPILRQNLRSDEDPVRLAVVHLLVECPSLLPGMAEECELLLTADRDGVAAHAAFLLGKSGPNAATRLVAGLRQPKSRIGPIAGALAQIGRSAAAVISQGSDDPDPRVRRGSALALGQIRPLIPTTTEKLTRGLADPDPEVRLASLTALGSLGPRAAEAVPAVRGMLGDRSPELRGRAIEVLFGAAPRDERMLDDLSPLLGDPDPRVQRQVIDAIRALGPPGRKVLGVVIGRLTSEDPDVRFAAAQMVESHGPVATAAIPALTRLLTDPRPKLRTIACTTLGRFGKESHGAFGSLASLLDDPEVGVREAATSALGSLELDAETLRPPLARALSDEKAEVRRAATRAIPKLGPRGVILVPDIIRMAARKENARSVDRLLRPFEPTGPDVRSIPELIKELDHEQVAVRLLAIKFLGLAGRNGSEALPSLDRLSLDSNPDLQRHSKAAIEQIKNETRSVPKTD